MKKYLSGFLAFVLIFSFEFNTEIFAGTTEISGFFKVKSEYVSDYDTVADTYEHIKTGAKVLVVNNQDEEKFFSIGFKTPPDSDKGTAHIFEHMVLQGSQKYPVKSMLSQLGASSSATYFNAVTSDDFTFYPFGSINEKDFYNLMSIYLDGIFSPMFLTEENVFKRDGIRIDVQDGKAKYNGVVYNEMKNASMNKESILYNSIKKSLYPDTYYKYVSGGVPCAITKLTYEEVVEFYKNTYHPSNSLTVLYGNQNLTASLSMLNEYFKNYEKKQAVETAYQKPFDALEEYFGNYPSLNQDNAVMSLNYAIPEQHSYEDIVFDLITVEILKLSQKNLHNINVTGNYTQISQGAISFYNMQEKESKEKFVEKIENSIKDIYENGVEKEYIEAVLDNLKYVNKAKITQRNLGYEVGYKAISGWAYRNNPVLMLDDTAIAENLAKRINSKEIQKNIKELFLDNNFKSLVVLQPDKDYESNQMQQLKENLINDLQKMDIEQAQEDTKKFYEWQKQKDSEEALKSIPVLSIEDIEKKKIDIECSNIIEIEKAELIQTYIDTDGISNIVLSFSMENIPQENLQYVSLWSKILAHQSTKKYTKEELSLKMVSNFGEFAAFSEVANNSARLNINIKTLVNKEKPAIELLEEIIFNTDLNDKENIALLLQNIKQGYEYELGDINSDIILNLSAAMTSESGKLKDYLEGYKFYCFICDLCNRIEADWEEISAGLKKSRELILNQEKLIIGYTSPKNKTSQFIKNIKPLVRKIPQIQGIRQIYSFEAYDTVFKITAPTITFAVIQTENIKNLGYSYKNNMRVLSNIVSKEYLWGEIREKAGAYHTAMNIGTDGSIKLIAYASPELESVINTYNETDVFVGQLKDMTQTELNKYIVNAAGIINNSLQEKNLWNYGINSYIKGFSLENAYRAREEIIKTTPEELTQYKELFKKLKKSPKYIIISNIKK